MICESCDVEMVTRTATRRDPYTYVLVGLPNVRLAGIKVWTCAECGVELPSIPHMEKLHSVIAGMVVRKPGTLTGLEVRYLRKQAGFSAKEFAALLGIDPSTLSRGESGKQPLGPAVDRLARAVSVVARDGETARDVLLTVARNLQKRSTGQNSKPTQLGLFTLNHDVWENAA